MEGSRDLSGIPPSAVPGTLPEKTRFDRQGIETLSKLVGRALSPMLSGAASFGQNRAEERGH